jgi:hypothetical protein
MIKCIWNKHNGCMEEIFSRGKMWISVVSATVMPNWRFGVPKISYTKCGLFDKLKFTEKTTQYLYIRPWLVPEKIFAKLGLQEMWIY